MLVTTLIEWLMQPARKRRRVASLLQSLVAAILILLAALAPAAAHAGVMRCGGYTGSTDNMTVAIGNVSISAANPPAVGSTIYTGSQLNYTARCNSSDGSGGPAGGTIRFDLNTAGYAPVPGYTDVFQTSVPGVGVRFNTAAYGNDRCTASSATLQVSPTTSVTCQTFYTAGASQYPRILITPSLIVTGPISAGGQIAMSGPTIGANYTPSDSAGASFVLPTVIARYTGQLVVATCSVSQPNVVVALPNVSMGSLSSGVGAIAGTQPFSLTFSCVSGSKVFVTLTDNVNPANRGNTLQLTADSTAKGIGVQVLNGSSPVSFGADSAAAGNTNQWLIGTSPNGPLQVPLTARYISTGIAAPGTVKALATFTMSYQ